MEQDRNPEIPIEHSEPEAAAMDQPGGLTEEERQMLDAEIREQAIRTALDRVAELRRAASNDHRFDDEYQRSIDYLAELVRREHEIAAKTLDDDSSES